MRDSCAIAANALRVLPGWQSISSLIQIDPCEKLSCRRILLPHPGTAALLLLRAVFCVYDGQPLEWPRGNADVAQLVEQLIRNQQVNGSSPFVGSIPFHNLLRLPEPTSRD